MWHSDTNSVTLYNKYLKVTSKSSNFKHAEHGAWPMPMEKVVPTFQIGKWYMKSSSIFSRSPRLQVARPTSGFHLLDLQSLQIGSFCLWQQGWPLCQCNMFLVEPSNQVVSKCEKQGSTEYEHDWQGLGQCHTLAVLLRTQEYRTPQQYHHHTHALHCTQAVSNGLVYWSMWRMVCTCRTPINTPPLCVLRSSQKKEHMCVPLANAKLK